MLTLIVLALLLVSPNLAQNDRETNSGSNDAGRGQDGRGNDVPYYVNVHTHPKTGFSCNDKKTGEYYADPQTNCAVYYICLADQYGRLSPTSFACPNGTIFSQATKVCSSQSQVSCNLATRYYGSFQGHIDSQGQNPNQYTATYENQPRTDTRRPPNQPLVAAAAPPARQYSGQNGRQILPAEPAPQPGPQSFAPLQPQARPALSPPTRRSQFRSFSGQSAAQTTTTPQPLPVEYVYDYDYDPNSSPASTGAGNQPNNANNNPARNKRSADEDKLTDRRARRKSVLEDSSLEASVQRVKPSNFTCHGKVAGIAYADVANECKMFHVCLPEAKGKLSDYQLFCDKGLGFNQLKAVCEALGKFDCSRSEKHYPHDKSVDPDNHRKNLWRLHKKLRTAGKAKPIKF